MQVHVKHRLPRVSVAVEHRPIATLRVTTRFRERGRAARHRSHERVMRRIEIVQRRDVDARDDQRHDAGRYAARL